MRIVQLSPALHLKSPYRLNIMKYSAKTVPKNQIPYKLAKDYKANLDLSKSWYVYYYYLEGEKYVRFRVKANVNRVNSIAHRVWAIDELCSSINEMLQNGIIPHLYDNYQDKKTDSFFNKCEVLKSEILNLYEKNTSKPYISAINIICDFLSNKKNIDCKKISDEHFSDFKIWLKSSGNRTNRTVNNILKNCNTIFNKMIEKKWFKICNFSMSFNLSCIVLKYFSSLTIGDKLIISVTFSFEV